METASNLTLHLHQTRQLYNQSQWVNSTWSFVVLPRIVWQNHLGLSCDELEKCNLSSDIVSSRAWTANQSGKHHYVSKCVLWKTVRGGQIIAMEKKNNKIKNDNDYCYFLICFQTGQYSAKSNIGIGHHPGTATAGGGGAHQAQNGSAG